ncbi:MAG TPA: hypothetical protein VGL23_12805 [Chloroflexota bacterium]
MAIGSATLTVAAQPSRVGTCDLCGTDAAVLAAAAVIRHRRGGVMQFAACDRCARGMRRLAAALGSAALVAPPLMAEAVGHAPVRAAPAHGPPQLVSQLSEEVISADGRRWAVLVYGEPRADGTWIGWLAFKAVRGEAVMRTGQETSQPDHGALAYWATGLQPSYLEGAFSRAH